MLSADELERYARHIVLREVGGPGQQALKEASVLVIGAGGLGAPALMYLAAAGVGTLGVVDDDHRVASQSAAPDHPHHARHRPPQGRYRRRTRCMRSIRMSALPRTPRGLKADNAMSLIGAYDLVLDGSDNFETRYLRVRRVLPRRHAADHGALGTFDGSLTTIRAHEKNAKASSTRPIAACFPSRRRRARCRPARRPACSARSPACSAR